MTFRFRSLKTTQAAAVLLALDDNSMDRMRLLKLLYIVDRELLAESGRTLTGDRAVAMKNGPVLSRIYDLIKGTELSPADWGRYLRSAGYKIMLLEDPGQGEMTKREIAKLHDVTERYRSVPTRALSAHTHRFPEWKNNYNVGTATPIPWRDALVATGNESKVEAIEKRLEEQGLIDSLFEV
jgi:uncharacterized phage-associated protein